MEWEWFAKMLAGLVAVIDPVGLVPLFIAMTEGMSAEEKRATVNKASLTALIVMLVSIVAGEAILTFFGISLPAFRIVGGILIMMMAFSMLNAEAGRTRRTPEEEKEAIEKHDVAVVPLGIPLIAGPGTISALIMYSHQAKSMTHYGLVAGAVVISTLAVFITLRLASPIARLLGRTGVNVVTRIMGLILAAVAIEFLARGLAELFPGLVAVAR